MYVGLYLEHAELEIFLSAGIHITAAGEVICRNMPRHIHVIVEHKTSQPNIPPGE